MRNKFSYRFLLVLLAVVAPLFASQAQTTFFSDNFSSSTTNKISTPGGTPTASSTSYDIASTKGTAVTIAPNLLHLTLAATTSSGFLEAQALFTTNAISLNSSNDYMEIDVVFTNSAGSIFNNINTGSALWVGLFNSGSTYGVVTNWPVPFAALAASGLTTGGSSPFATGNCALWQGYVGQISSNATSHMVTRPLQNGSLTTSAAQELLGNGAGSGAYANPGATFSANGPSTTINLLTNVAYTMSFRVTLSWLVPQQELTISNAIYQGVGTSGTLLFSQITTNINNASFIADAFDGFGIGALSKSATATPYDPVVDISSISVFGVSTLPTGPPTITSQPIPVQVVTGGASAFSVSAFGQNVSYQWFRNSTKLNNGGDIAGATSSQLIVSPAGPGDQFTGVNNGYYCVVTGAGPFSTNTVTNTLTLITSTNLIWGNQVNNGIWDINDSTAGNNWVDQNNSQAVFNYGDPVTFDDSQGNSGGTVTILTNFTSPSSVTIVGNDFYVFQGPGSLAGPTPLWDFASARVTFGAANPYTGGTLISNATAYVLLQNNGGMGSGPITVGKAGGAIEVVTAGSVTSGFQGKFVVADDFTVFFDTTNAFSGVFLNDLSGTVGKTLTLSPTPLINPDSSQIRVRAYGGNTVFNANINLSDANVLLASYESSGSQTYNGVISGPGAFMQKGVTTTFNGNNTYSGGTYPAQGATGIGVSSAIVGGIPIGGLGTGPILLGPDSTTSTTGNGFIFATVPNIVVSNAVQYVSGTNNLTLDIGGSQNISMNGPFTLSGNDHTIMTAFPTRTLNVTNTALTTMVGVIGDNGSNYAFNLTGSGITLFNATEAWGGATTNLGGTMLVNGQIGPSNVVIMTNATLGGTGTVAAQVAVQIGGTLTAGSEAVAGTPQIGTLHFNNTVTLAAGSTNFVKVNKTGATSDAFTGITTMNYGGTLIATNISATASVLGDSYNVYSAGAHTGTFANILGSPGPGLAWSFNPATGVLSVIQGQAGFTVRPFIGSITLSGTNIVLSGTNAQSGAIYYTLTTTNLSLPLSQWTPVATNTSGTANNYTMTITNAVNTKDNQQYYIFSNVP